MLHTGQMSPNDPITLDAKHTGNAFTLIGTSNTASFMYNSPEEHRYFLVIGQGTDGREIAPGHYGE